MSYENLSKENVEFFLQKVAKEFKKEYKGKAHAEIVIVGGAAIMLNYGFRNLTQDVDAVARSSAYLYDAIHAVGDKYELPTDWFNSDFTKTKSYSPKIFEKSKYYKTYEGVLEIRTISAEYLVAMKAKSYRPYKNDISDIIGIIQSDKLSFSQIDKATTDLYGGWDNLLVKEQIQNMCAIDLTKQYDLTKQKEHDDKQRLLSFEKDYPNTLSSDNIESVLQQIKLKEQSEQKSRNTKYKNNDTMPGKE